MKKFNVPYYEQTKRYPCGPTNFKMATAYLGKKLSFSKAKSLVRTLHSGLTFVEGIVLGAHDLGLGVKYYASNFKVDLNIPYAKENLGKSGEKILKDLTKNIKDKSIETKKKNTSLNELLSYLTKNSIPIVLVNTNVLDRKPGYNGHYLTIVGYDNKTIYVHNSGARWPFAYWPIKKKLFLEAWSSKTADRKTVVLSKKN